MALLLHSCCGPCLGAAAPALREENPAQALVTFWENPNIHPYLEFFQRFESFKKMATSLDLEVISGEMGYGLRVFLREIGEALTRPDRCAVCFRLRLTATAREARARRFEAFSTTLLISPYQDRELLVKIGHEVARDHGLPFADPDLRPFFRGTYEAARREDLYRQKYCGCIFSEEERFQEDRRFQIQTP